MESTSQPQSHGAEGNSSSAMDTEDNNTHQGAQYELIPVATAANKRTKKRLEDRHTEPPVSKHMVW